jgi:hypothetical protein
MIGRASLAGLTAAAVLVAGTVAAAQASSASRHHGGAGAVAALRASTNRFHNLQKAENAGYGFFTDAKGIACIAMPHMGGMGVHFVNGSLVGDPAERVRHPEAMVYRVDSKGMLRLSAVEYVVLASAWNAKHNSPPKLFGHTFQFTKAPNRYGLPDFYSLHAWVWYHNPAGRFAMWNPRVKC